VVQRGNIHPVLKIILFISMIVPTVGCILMAMGAWRPVGDAWDGGLISVVSITGFFGFMAILLLDKLE